MCEWDTFLLTLILVMDWVGLLAHLSPKELYTSMTSTKDVVFEHVPTSLLLCTYTHCPTVYLAIQICPLMRILGFMFDTISICNQWCNLHQDLSVFFRSLLLGENDFQAVLRENFPDLGTHLMRRAEWTKIRRLMGKPRRYYVCLFIIELWMIVSIVIKKFSKFTSTTWVCPKTVISSLTHSCNKCCSKSYNL